MKNGGVSNYYYLHIHKMEFGVPQQYLLSKGRSCAMTMF